MIERVDKSVDKLREELKDLAIEIHDNPELGLKEYKACALQVELLKKYGFEVDEKYLGIETAYRAKYKGAKKGPKIAMLAEYDALPKIGHACGHNLIAMVSVGAGIAMREYADEFGGEIYVFGTPAEETKGKKVEMTNKGAFDDIDVAMMAHPAYMNTESVRLLAIKSYSIEFFGKGAHSAASPEEGLNALDAMINFYNTVNALRQQTKPDARIHGIITDGGTAANIVPDYTKAVFNMRANEEEYLTELCEKIFNCAKGAALASGCKVEIKKADEHFKNVKHNKTLSELNVQQLEKLGLPVMKLGNMVFPGSSDIGDVSYAYPAIQGGFDITKNALCNVHTPEFAEYARSEYAIDNSMNIIKGFVLTAIELMTNPEKLKEIKEEFNK
ncbi:MAG: M20 family metallopeptidase [Peptostreptococcaceae bacterium]|nr:M20 family metallopeptidase [Peptostreptococcaceae bacterium]